MKNRTKDPSIIIFFEGIFVLFLLFGHQHLAKLMYSNDVDAEKKCFAILILITAIIYVVLAIWQWKSYEKAAKIQRDRKNSKLMQTLKNGSELQVFLNNSGNLVEDSLNCHVSLDKDGKLLCRIFLDDCIKFNTPEEFFKYFHIDK